MAKKELSSEFCIFFMWWNEPVLETFIHIHTHSYITVNLVHSSSPMAHVCQDLNQLFSCYEVTELTTEPPCRLLLKWSKLGVKIMLYVNSKYWENPVNVHIADLNPEKKGKILKWSQNVENTTKTLKCKFRILRRSVKIVTYKIKILEKIKSKYWEKTLTSEQEAEVWENNKHSV